MALLRVGPRKQRCQGRITVSSLGSRWKGLSGVFLRLFAGWFEVFFKQFVGFCVFFMFLPMGFVLWVH